jgi:hypothetical protein
LQISLNGSHMPIKDERIKIDDRLSQFSSLLDVGLAQTLFLHEAGQVFIFVGILPCSNQKRIDRPRYFPTLHVKCRPHLLV